MTTNPTGPRPRPAPARSPPSARASTSPRRLSAPSRCSPPASTAGGTATTRCSPARCAPWAWSHARAGVSGRRTSDGATCTWGRVLTWDPPRTFAFAWLVGPDWGVPADDAPGSRVTGDVHARGRRHPRGARARPARRARRGLAGRAQRRRRRRRLAGGAARLRGGRLGLSRRDAAATCRALVAVPTGDHHGDMRVRHEVRPEAPPPERGGGATGRRRLHVLVVVPAGGAVGGGRPGPPAPATAGPPR